MKRPNCQAPAEMVAEVGALCDAARQGKAPIYGMLLRENVADALAASFPDTCARLGREQLEMLMVGFVSGHGAIDPQFHRIAAEFVTFVQAQPGVKPTLLALLEYEWLQLAVEIDPAIVPPSPSGAAWPGDLPLALNPTVQFVLLPFDLTHDDAFETAADVRLPYALYRTADHRVVTQSLTVQDCLLIEIIREADALTPDRLVCAAAHVRPEGALRDWTADAIERGLLFPYLP